MTNPFFITGPAIISFSGGRTSAYLLWRVLQAHGGTLPSDVVVCFSNTGREMPATLDFVRDCGAQWNVAIHWLEYSRDEKGPTFKEVSHNSASRDGEPFEAIFTVRPMLPNPVARYCTVELKIRTVKRFVVASLGWKHWTNIVGLRADEPGRVAKAVDPKRQKDRWDVLCPLATDGIQEIDVLRFWRSQSFDLRLKGPWEGNCDGCFLKRRASIERMLRDHPKRMEWWARMEANRIGTANRKSAETFRIDRESYALMTENIHRQIPLPFDLNESEIPCADAGCGV
jgi:3'-phosphoadenosine 5'-phosphosulfate sulfotransferase (PAPS reductase)/FAD synthetase